MGNGIGVSFNGVDIKRPGVYTSVDASAMVPLRSGLSDVVGVVGVADGGVAGKVYSFTDYDSAKKVLKGGPILSFLSRIFNPSPDLPGASMVRFIRAGSPTAATYVLNAHLTLDALEEGRSGNGIYYSITAGSADSVLKTRAAGGSDTAYSVRVITIERPLESYKRTQTLRHGLTISTTVTPAGATKNSILEVPDGSNAYLYMSESGIVVAQLHITATSTTRDVANWINSRAGWKATVIGDYDMPALSLCFFLGTGNPGDVGFDANAQPVTTTSFFLPSNGCGAVAYLLNRYDAQVSAVLTDTVPNYLATLPGGALSQVAFSGGAGSGLDTMDSNDLADALVLMSTVDIQHLFIQSMDPALQQLAYLHTLEMRTTNAKKYRIFYAGFNGWAATGTYASPVAVDPSNAEGYPVISPDTWDQIAGQAARTLDGPVVLCANGTVTANPVTGLPEQLHGLGLAAQVCGMAAGSPVAIPTTNKSLISQGLEYASIDDATVDNLLQGGVTFAYYDSVQGRTVIMQGLTTYQGGANVSFRKLQGLRIQDAVHRLFQRSLARYVGYPLDESTGQLIYQDCAKALDGAIYSPNNQNGFLTRGIQNGAQIPAWTNLTVKGDGLEVWSIDVELHPVGESDYILVNARLTPVPIQL